MENSIGVGLIVGLITASSIYVWSSDEFTKDQKVFLLIAVIFAPVQWLGILVIKYYNKNKFENTPERKTEKKLDSTISNLTELKEKGILTEEEYKTKVEKINTEKDEQSLKNSVEYKQLKSLFDSGVLTNEEFESKVEILNSRKREKRTDEFRIIDGFSEGLALAINSDLDYGFIDENREVIISFKFEHAENFIDGVAKVRYNGEFKSIDKKGDFI